MVQPNQPQGFQFPARDAWFSDPAQAALRAQMPGRILGGGRRSTFMTDIVQPAYEVARNAAQEAYDAQQETDRITTATEAQQAAAQETTRMNNLTDAVVTGLAQMQSAFNEMAYGGPKPGRVDTQLRTGSYGGNTQFTPDTDPLPGVEDVVQSIRPNHPLHVSHAGTAEADLVGANPSGAYTDSVNSWRTGGHAAVDTAADRALTDIGTIVSTLQPPYISELIAQNGAPSAEDMTAGNYSRLLAAIRGFDGTIEVVVNTQLGKDVAADRAAIAGMLPTLGVDVDAGLLGSLQRVSTAAQELTIASNRYVAGERAVAAYLVANNERLLATAPQRRHRQRQQHRQ